MPICMVITDAVKRILKIVFSLIMWLWIDAGMGPILCPTYNTATYAGLERFAACLY